MKLYLLFLTHFFCRHKQQGQSAVDSMNMFHHLFYEGAVNIDEIDDPLKRNAIIGFINNFGQIPKQLFKKPHPSKKLNVQLIHGPSSLASNLINATAANLVGAVNTGQQGSSSNTLTSNSSSSNLQSDHHHHHHHQSSHQNQPLVFINSLKSLKPRSTADQRAQRLVWSDNTNRQRWHSGRRAE